MKSNKKNFCGGNFADWLEVMLIEKCNGRCSWCIEKEGFHPLEHLSWQELVDCIEKSGKKNIILLGGEPTLYTNLKEVINSLSQKGMNIYLTTNGSMLTPSFVKEKLLMLKGINISIHNYDLIKNKEITGIELIEKNLKELINVFESTNVRLNCNLIKGNIDTYEQIYLYIEFAKRIEANSIRFAELKNSKSEFVDLTDIFGNKYGINNEPFGLGCNTDVVINDMPVNFRQMCGLQTSKRHKPENPEQVTKQVLYYNGHIYNGWQKGINIVDEHQIIRDITKDFLFGELTETEASQILKYIFSEKEQEEIITILQESKSQLQPTPEQKIRNIAQQVAEEHGMGGGCSY